MRVITGEARGRRLKTPEGLEVRPTPERVKEAVFSMLHDQLPGAAFLDLFCGCGQMGIEALSRGARRAVLVDASHKSCQLAKENLAHCKLQERGEVVRLSAEDYVKGCREKFDFIFLDPPYHQNLAAEILPLLENLLNPGGCILVETERRDPLPQETERLALAKQNGYGIVRISTYRHKEEV
ncbi:MAG: 16S rRNA (guanine(966)-N(2))-methyltransferase RsmD [Oscillospiraceae bacterium]|nr:16S rRNA (guanine(966)-N(2))-methyltransferase RsmD [Oscillospiraceae bacterium]